MNDFPLIEKIDILMKLISSSSLFLVCSIIAIAFLSFLVFCIVTNKKVNKWLFISITSLISIIILINYGTLIIKIVDKVIDMAFMALYFPNIVVYTSVLIISNVFFIMSLFSKKIIKSHKISNIVNSLFLDFLLILVIDVLSKNNINILDEINLYTNSTLLVLLQLSMGIFTSWLLVNLILSAHCKLKKFDKIEYPEMPEILFE